MDNLSQLTEQDYEKMAIDIVAISQKDESEIYQTIGEALHHVGYTALNPITHEVIRPDSIYQEEGDSHLRGLSILNPDVPGMHQPTMISRNLIRLDTGPNMNFSIEGKPDMQGRPKARFKRQALSKNLGKAVNLKPELLNKKPTKTDLNENSFSKIEAKEEGKSFWKNFNLNLQHEICSNKKFMKLISDKSTLKESLILGVPIVLSAIGIVTVSPALLLIVASVFALIIKVGFKAYCSMDFNAVTIIKKLN